MAKPRSNRAPAPLERDIQAAVLEHWRLLGRPMTLVAAIPNAGAMGQPGLTCGLPDLLVMGPDIPGGLPIAFMELKRNNRREPTEDQQNFALLCTRLGLMCPIVRGRDEPIAYLEKWNVVRAQKYPEPLAPSRRMDAA